MDPTKPGLLRADDKPFPGAYVHKLPRESGAGGLVSTLGDTVRLIQSIVPGGATLVKASTLEQMYGSTAISDEWPVQEGQTSRAAFRQ